MLAHGKTLGVYGWLYKDVNIQQQCQDWVSLIQDMGVSIPVLWIDIEPYQSNDNLPSIEQIEEAVNIIHGFGLNPGIYTGPWVWSLLRNRVSSMLNACPLWTAEYNHLDTLTDVNLYGGWTSAVGHQYDDKPLDMDVFDYAYTVAA